MDDEDDLEGECVPLDMVMQMLVEELDVPVRLKLGAECAVAFAIVLDFCRGSLSNFCCVDVTVYSEPEKASPAPYKYIIIFMCSRTMPVMARVEETSRLQRQFWIRNTGVLPREVLSSQPIQGCRKD